MNDIALHDRFFKSTLGRPDRLGSVLKAFLPSELSASLDPGSLVPLPTESVGEGLDVSLMDLAFSARFGGEEAEIHLIVEHKSSPDEWVHFQIIHYLCGLWVRERKEKRSPRPFLPVLFYHGSRPWNTPLRLSEVLRPPSELFAVNPDFALPIIDLHRIRDEEIRKGFRDVETVLALLSLKHIFDTIEQCARILLQEIWERQAPYDTIKPEMDYLSGVYGITDSQEMKRILGPIVKEVGMAQGIVDTWMEQWLQQGIQQGIQQTQIQMVRRLLQRGGFSLEEIASLVNVDLARVREIAESTEKNS
jgi:predicted transposase YdaD